MFCLGQTTPRCVPTQASSNVCNPFGTNLQPPGHVIDQELPSQNVAGHGTQKPAMRTFYANGAGVSCCGNLQIRYWDITAGEQLFRLDGHSDYVRSSACSPSSPDTWATGEAPTSAAPLLQLTGGQSQDLCGRK